VHNGRIREKPASEEEARAFIASYADGPATTVGACVCVCLDTGISYEHVEVNKAHIDKLPDATIDQLIQEGNVFKCAGGALCECAV
jgi:septum formation protein